MAVHNPMIFVGKHGALDSTRHFQCQQLPAVVQFSNDSPGDCSAFAVIIEGILVIQKNELAASVKECVPVDNNKWAFCMNSGIYDISLISCTLIA